MADNLYVEIVAPDRSVFRGEAASVRAPGVEGSFQVLRGHAPMIAAFGVGPLYVTTTDDKRIAYATSGGFLEVLNDRVTVLAESAEPVDQIDVDRAREAEQRALERLQSASEVDRARAERALERARNRLRLGMGQVGAR